MIYSLRRRIVQYQRWGLARSARIAVDKAVLTAARRVFGFHEWHAQAPTSLRTYRIGLAAMAKDIRAKVVVEVGCGLGSVLARIDAPVRVGYDVDAGVIRAAAALRSRAITFRVGGFPDVVEPAIDLLIAVNWLHDFSPDQLDQWFTRILSRTRYLIVDSISPTSPTPYRYFHDFEFLRDRTTCLRTETLGETHRAFMLFEVNV